MNTIWRLIGSRALWVFLGALGLSLLIWFFGALLAVGDVRPFANTYVRFIAAIGVFLIWFTRFAIRQIRQSRQNAALVKEIQVAQEPMLKHVNKDSEMSRQFAEIDRVLKNAKFSKSKVPLLGKFTDGQYLYQMPWYVVLGAAGSGKTTALKQSGLNFPLESSFGSSISGLAGTRDCDWFLTDDAVLLDTAGRLSLHGSDNEHDTYDWQEFINLLKRYRPKQPINGVILTVGVDDLLNTKTDFKQLAYELRKRIHEMSSSLEINFPVYLMITKFDMLKGFSDFFGGLSEEQRKQSLGFDFTPLEMTVGSEVLIGYVSKQLQEIQEGIDAASIKVLSELNDLDAKDAAFVFSSEFEHLSENLLTLFRELYKTSKFENPISWRGIYFTSATQQGEVIDPVFEHISPDLALNKKYVASQELHSSMPKSFFLQEFFEHRVFGEANLASENKKWSIKKLAMYWLGLALLILLAGALFIAMINSYLRNSRYLDSVSEQTTKLQKTANDMTASGNFLARVEFADSVKRLHINPDVPDINNPKLSYRFGLYQAKDMSMVTQSAYQRLLQDDVMPLVSKEIDGILRESNMSQSYGMYNALKAYLMLFDKKHYDPEFLNAWASQYFLQRSSQYSDAQRDKIKEALGYILSQKNLVPNITYDAKIVESKRSELANLNISDMIVAAAFSRVGEYENKIPGISLESMGGKQTKLVFLRHSGKPLTANIHPFYTKKAYTEHVLPDLIKYSVQFHQEEWVLGGYSSIRMSETDTLIEAHDAYLDLYVKAWKDYIGDIRLKQPKSIKEARDITKILSDQNNSPLANIIKGVSGQTSLNVLPDSADNTVIDNYLQQLINKMGLGRLVSASDLQEKYLNSLKQSTTVDDAFNDFHVLTKTQEGQPSTIVSVIDSIKELYEYLDVLNIAIEKGVDLPPHDSLFKYRAEINRLPVPFKGMLENFSGFALDKSLSEQGLRDLQAEEKALRAKQDEEEKAKKAQQEAEEKAERQASEAKVQQESLVRKGLESQLAIANKECSDVIQAGYPFIKNSPKDISLTAFTKVFGKENSYKALQVLPPEIARTMQATTLEELFDRDEYYKNKFSNVVASNPITQTYFTGNTEKPEIDFSIRVKELDKSVDSLIVEYDGKKLRYSHGPVVALNSLWPARSESASTKITLHKDNKEIGRIDAKGIWSIFRLIEKSDKREWQGSKLLASYLVNQKKFTLEIASSNTRSPFNFSTLRDFKCP
ncbi:type VI secretion system protein ImpL [Moraxella cuniculi DSM 21768]|uniref:Type VI secretion system protein ImpL n=1 Tax=Moraxella cuniculi DSM 21768 TaxID=1122245 RepID=A0A1N7G9N1_9GAMM|nr:type VI secretion system membrane subunit TssM [Moraxella cuniculi]OOS06119.1 hypothetical protein B0189_05700 [Moraxella cuniculi]SIS09300.1 type VI secretion system protein ImpL [Moraxella cuniculi DSM 21768]